MKTLMTNIEQYNDDNSEVGKTQQSILKTVINLFPPTERPHQTARHIYTDCSGTNKFTFIVQKNSKNKL